MIDNIKRAIEISLKLPLRNENVGGYWSNCIDSQPVGSLLYTLTQEKITSQTDSIIKSYVQKSLKWLDDQQIDYKLDILTDRQQKIIVITIDNEKVEINI